MAFSPDGQVLLTATADGIHAWDTESGKERGEFIGHRRWIQRLRFESTGDRFVSASDDNTAQVWSMATGELLREVRTPGSPILDADFTPDGLRLATVDTFLTNAVKIWELGSGNLAGVSTGDQFVGAAMFLCPQRPPHHGVGGPSSDALEYRVGSQGSNL